MINLEWIAMWNFLIVIAGDYRREKRLEYAQHDKH